MPHWTWSLLKYSIRWPDACILTARVRITDIMSSDPPSTRLLGSWGSYSQIAAVVSTAPILVIWPMTAMLARFTTCARHLVLVY